MTPEILQHLRDVRRLMALNDEEPVQRPRHTLESIALFHRCRRLVDAIIALLERDLADEAGILARPLYTASLTLQEMAAADDAGRVRLVVGWALQTLGDLDGLLIEAASYGDEVAVHRQALEKQRQQLREYAERHGVRAHKWKPDGDVKKLSARHGRDEYLDFVLSHHWVHGSTFSLSHLYVLEDNVVHVGAVRHPSGDYSDPVAIWSSSSALHATRAAAAILELQVSSALEAAVAATEHLSEELAAER